VATKIWRYGHLGVKKAAFICAVGFDATFDVSGFPLDNFSFAIQINFKVAVNINEFL
jgi:hypothetical protein